MILVGNQRGGAKQMALHLLSEENEHVTVHQVDGFVAQDVQGALQEIYAVSRATKCDKFMFSLSLSPPKEETAKISDFDKAIQRVETKLGLNNQPKVVVFHEKEGRKHAHCVWSRINTDELKAIKLDYYKKDLNRLAKELFIEHGWDMPNGFKDGQSRDKRNFTLEEHQQAKRHQLNPKRLKARIQHCWKQSDNKASFKSALEHEGFFLARGDKKNVHVAVDWNGEVYAITRATEQKAKDVKAKLGEPDTSPTVEATKAIIAKEQSALHDRLRKELALKHQTQSKPILARKAELVSTHQSERKQQKIAHEKRQQQEQQQRQATYQKGIRGLFQFLTGRYHKQRKRHEAEYQAGLKRDEQEKHTLVERQLKTRQALQAQLDAIKTRQQKEQMQLNRDFMADHKGQQISGELSNTFNQHLDAAHHLPMQQPNMGP